RLFVRGGGNVGTSNSSVGTSCLTSRTCTKKGVLGELGLFVNHISLDLTGSKYQLNFRPATLHADVDSCPSSKESNRHGSKKKERNVARRTGSAGDDRYCVVSLLLEFGFSAILKGPERQRLWLLRHEQHARFHQSGSGPGPGRSQHGDQRNGVAEAAE